MRLSGRFGIEVEFNCSVDYMNLRTIAKRMYGDSLLWEFGSDASVCTNKEEFNYGLEVRTVPIRLKQINTAYAQLMGFLSEVKYLINRSCGLHIHYGLNRPKVTNGVLHLVKNFHKDKSMHRELGKRKFNDYCVVDSIGDILAECLEDNHIELYYRDRYRAVNLPFIDGKHNTIEYRHFSPKVIFGKQDDFEKLVKFYMDYTKDNLSKTDKICHKKNIISAVRNNTYLVE